MWHRNTIKMQHKDYLPSPLLYPQLLCTCHFISKILLSSLSLEFVGDIFPGYIYIKDRNKYPNKLRKEVCLSLEFVGDIFPGYIYKRQK